MHIHASPYTTIVAPLARLGHSTSPWLVYWMGLSRAERLATLAIVTGGLIAIINSTAWAFAVSYMARQKTRAMLRQPATPQVPSAEHIPTAATLS